MIRILDMLVWANKKLGRINNDTIFIPSNTNMYYYNINMVSYRFYKICNKLLQGGG